MMRLFILLVFLFLSFTVRAEYAWYTYDTQNKTITFGTRWSDCCNDKKTFICEKNPIFVTIDRECDIAYVTQSSLYSSNISVLELSDTIIKNYEVIRGFKVILHPFSVESQGKHYRRERSLTSIETAILTGEAWKLFTELFCFDKGFDIMGMVSVLPDTNLILNHTNESLDVNTLKNFFTEKWPELRAIDFKKALAAMNPYAYSLMYLALKHGLWGIKPSEQLATIYKDGADKKTIESAEKNLEIIRKGLNADPIDKQY